ncbi:MAG: DUF4349 domain-containing protein [Acidimicrobiales bacterium]
MRRTRILASVTVATLVLLAACSGAQDDAASTDDAGGDTTASADESAGDSSDSAEVGAGADADEAARGGGQTVTDVGDVDLIAAELDRRIVYRGDIASEVDDVVSAARSARDEIAAEGGYVFGQEISAGSARVVLKVPSVRFDAAFDAVAGIGEVTSQTIEADDVSEQFTDLQSRRATLEASIVRLRGFLDGTTNVDEISRLESELTHREAERDVIAGQLRVLEDRTSFGTISVAFTVPDDADLTVAQEEDEAGGPPGFGRGLEVGWDGVVFAAGVIATASGFVLPFLPVAAAVVALLWWMRRRQQLGVNALADRPS